jgi:death on curing protein
MQIKSISIVEVEQVAHSLACQLMTWNEPIPDFGSRFPNVLESCIAVPFAKFARKNLYHGLLEKAAILFYLMIKNHPFENGNKRIAVTTLLYFLLKNEKWLDVDNTALYNFAVWVAESPAVAKGGTITAIESFLKVHMVPFWEKIAATE